MLIILFFNYYYYYPGFEHGHHPSAESVPAAGQRARPPKTLQQESSAHGLDQEK